MDYPMTSQDIIRTGLILGAIWLLVGGVASVSEITANLAFTSVSSFALSWDWEWIGAITMMAGSAFLSVLVFSVLPAWIVLRRSSQWSAWLSESTQSHSELPASLAYGAAMLVLGIYFGVTGAAGLLGGAAHLAAELSSTTDASSWREAAAAVPSSFVYLVSGIFVYRMGSQTVVHAA
jgi:hypothetical protein